MILIIQHLNMIIKILTTTTWLQQQLSGKSVQLAHLHLVPGPNMWARVNLRFEVEVFAGFANSYKKLQKLLSLEYREKM